MFRILFVVGLLLSGSAWGNFGNSFKLKAEHLKFVYQPVQSAPDLNCTHTLINELSQDWEVLCKDKDEKVRQKYSVHLWVSKYGHSNGPKVSYEVLYWVDDRTQPKEIKSHGTTTWFHLNEETSLHSLQLSQFVDNGIASLALEIKAPN